MVSKVCEYSPIIAGKVFFDRSSCFMASIYPSKIPHGLALAGLPKCQHHSEVKITYQLHLRLDNAADHAIKWRRSRLPPPLTGTLREFFPCSMNSASGGGAEAPFGYECTQPRPFKIAKQPFFLLGFGVRF